MNQRPLFRRRLRAAVLDYVLLCPRPLTIEEQRVRILSGQLVERVRSAINKPRFR